MSKTLTISEIASKIGSGATPKGGKQAYLGGKYALIRSQNVHDFTFSFDGLAYINEEQAKQLDNVTVKKNDVLLNITGDSIARCCIVPDSILPARVNQHVSIIRCKNTKDSEYMKYYLINLKSYLMQICGVGGTRNALTQEAIKKLPIIFHDNHLSLASVLSSLDKKIELNNKINKELEAMAKTLYDYWFVQFDFPDENGKTYKSSGGKMEYKDELKREIPQGWDVKELGEYAEIKRGNLITEKDAGVGDIKVVAAGLDYSYLHSKSNRKKNTITVSGSGANAGHINFWREPIFASDCTTVRGHNDVTTIMIWQYLTLHQEHLYSQAKGSAQPHVYPDDIKNLYFPIVPNSLVKNFERIVLPINKKIASNQQENNELIKLRDWLLPMLMNGQVKVK